MNKLLLILIIILIIIFYDCIYKISEKFTNEYDDEYILPKRIYCYWDDLDGNDLIKCFSRNWNKKFSKEWQIIIISKDTLKDYVDKDFLDKYKNLPAFRFSDFLRLELLINKGGVWMDLSTIIIDGTFIDKFHNEMIREKYEACIYELKHNSNKQKFKYYPYLENWFIMAPKNSRYLRDLYKEFAKAEHVGFLHYKKSILVPTGLNFDKIFNKDENNTYLMQHGIINYLLFKERKYHLNVKNASDGFLKILIENNFDNKKTADYILNSNLNGHYAIKLVKADRNNIRNVTKFIEKVDSF